MTKFKTALALAGLFSIASAHASPLMILKTQDGNGTATVRGIGETSKTPFISFDLESVNPFNAHIANVNGLDAILGKEKQVRLGPNCVVSSLLLKDKSDKFVLKITQQGSCDEELGALGARISGTYFEQNPLKPVLQAIEAYNSPKPEANCEGQSHRR